MNREDIIRMAREAGVYAAHTELTLMAGLERFAALVRADEREACVEAVRKEWMDGSKPTFLRDLENAIRSRGQEA
jgi:hypothetical protein